MRRRRTLQGGCERVFEKEKTRVCFVCTSRGRGVMVGCLGVMLMKRCDGPGALVESVSGCIYIDAGI
jgi:hypothetical protein